MKKTYTIPEYEIDKFSSEDFITTSDPPSDGTGANTDTGEINSILGG